MSDRVAGAVTNPKGTEQLHRYWVHGEGAAKIQWEAPGSFARCVAELGKYISDPEGYCNLAHHAATGRWYNTGGGKKGRSMDWYDQGGTLPAGMTLTTSRTLLDAGITADEAAELVRANNKPYGNVTYADPKNGKYPIDTKAHAQAAWSYINKPANAAKYPLNGVTLAAVKGRIKAACKKFGITISEGNSADPDGEYRTVPFDIAGTEINGDGLTFEGYAAVYNTVTRVQGRDEDFDEQIAPGAFRSATEKHPVLMFEHGRHPLIGTMPLGRITRASEDSQGLWIEARLTDNWLIQPVRDAVADKALKGMSFRFTVNGDNGDTWMPRADDVALRTLLNLIVPELGPVVFPQYEPTTASVRSLLDQFDYELPVIGRPQAGARAASDREGDAGQRPPQTPEDRYRADSEALALRGIKGVKL
jgi:HK97 family phage prohead protease